MRNAQPLKKQNNYFGNLALLCKSANPTTTWFAILFLLLLIYYGPALSLKSDFYMSDLTFYFEPFCQFIKKNLDEGNFPLWNPHLYTGMSQIAVPSPGLFYFPNYIFFLSPYFSQAISIYMILHHLLAGLGAYLLAKELRLNTYSAIFAGISFSLTNYSFALIQNFSLPVTIAWLPLSIYFCICLIQNFYKLNTLSLSKFLSDKSFKAPLLGSCFSIAMLELSGRPEVGVPSLVILVSIIFLASTINYAKQKNIKALTCLFVLFTCIFGIASLLSMPEILPSLEWTSLSPRSKGLLPKFALLWSANWYDFFGIICPQALGDLSQLTDFAAKLRVLALSRSGSIPFLTTCYICPLILVLGIWGICSYQLKLKTYFISATIFSSALAAGKYTPLAGIIFSIFPFFSSFRYPVKLLIFPCLFLMASAIYAFNLVLNKQISKKMLIISTSIFSLIFIFSLIWLNIPSIQLLKASSNNIDSTFIFAANYLLALSILKSTLIVLAFLVLCTLYKYEQISKIIFANTSILILSVCLTTAALADRKLTAYGHFENNSELAKEINKLLSENNTTHTIHSRILPLYFDPLIVPYTYYNYKNNDPSELFYDYERSMLICNTFLDYNFSSSFGYEAAETNIYRNFYRKAYDLSSQSQILKPNGLNTNSLEVRSDLPLHRFCYFTATKFICTQMKKLDGTNLVGSLDSRFFTVINENNKLNYRIYKVQNNKPVYYFADKIQLNTNENKLLETLLDTNIMNTSYKEITSISKYSNKNYPELFKLSKLDNLNSNNSKINSVKCIEHNGESYHFILKRDNPGIFVLACQNYPGWQTYLDGKSIDTLNANLINRAYYIPSGTHELKLLYRPWSLYLSLIACSVSLMSIFFYAFYTKTSSKNSAAINSKNLETENSISVQNNLELPDLADNSDSISLHS